MKRLVAIMLVLFAASAFADANRQKIAYDQDEPEAKFYFNIGAGHTWIDHANISRFSVTRQPGLDDNIIFSSASTRSWLPDLSIAFGQTFSNNIGYEVNAHYYPALTAKQTYTGQYPLNSEETIFAPISATATKKVNGLSGELLFTGVWGLASWFDLIGKVGAGFIHVHEYSIYYTALIGQTDLRQLKTNSNFHNNIGPAIAGEMRFKVSKHIAISLEVNELAAVNKALMLDAKLGYLF